MPNEGLLEQLAEELRVAGEERDRFRSALRELVDAFFAYDHKGPNLRRGYRKEREEKARIYARYTKAMAEATILLKDVPTRN